MNTSADIPILPSFAKPATQFEDCVRKHPGGTLLVAAGLGIAAVLFVRAMTPTPPRNRAVLLLEDIQNRLADLVENGGHALSKGADSLSELHLDRKFNKISRSLKNLFQ